MTEPKFYIPENNVDNTALLVAGLSSAVEQFLIDATDEPGRILTKSLKFLGKANVGSQIIVESYDIIVNGEDNSVTLPGAVIDMSANAAGTALTAAALGAAGLTGGTLIFATAAGAGAVSVAYSAFLEPIVNDAIEVYEGKDEANLIDTGFGFEGDTLLAGMVYPDGLPGNDRDAVHALINTASANGIDPIGHEVHLKTSIGSVLFPTKYTVRNAEDGSGTNYFLEIANRAELGFGDFLSQNSGNYVNDEFYGVNDAGDDYLIYTRNFDTDQKLALPLTIAEEQEEFLIDDVYFGGTHIWGKNTNAESGLYNLVVTSQNSSNDIGTGGSSIFLGGESDDVVSIGDSKPSSSFSHYFLGQAGNDNFTGGFKNDTLDGGADNDSLNGGDGNDTYVLSGGNDTITDLGTHDNIQGYRGTAIETATDSGIFKLGDGITITKSGSTLSLEHENGVTTLTNWRQGDYGLILEEKGDPEAEAPTPPISPIALDLGGNGTIDTYNIRSSLNNAYFDIDNDGFKEGVEWLKPSDGWLALDKNGDGIINNQSELFGNSDGLLAYEKLAQLDSNNSGYITSSDAQWNDVRVWQDSNVNGISEAGELYTLNALGISSLSLETQPLQSTFVRNGETHLAEDIFLDVDQLNSWYIGTDNDVSEAALALPRSRGYGELASLHYAASASPALMVAIEEIRDLSLNQLDSLYEKLEHALELWAGTTSVSSDGIHTLVDWQHKATMERVTGTGDDSLPVHSRETAYNLEKAYSDLLGDLSIRFLAQGALKDILGEPLYDFGTDRMIYSIAPTDILANAQAAEPSNATDKAIYWQEIARALLKHSDDEFDVSEATMQNLIDNAAGYPVLVQQLGGRLIEGTSENDTLTGTSGIEYIVGNDGDDVIFGLDGDDMISGLRGNDTLYGGRGDDGFHNPSGNDVFHYARGDGHDWIMGIKTSRHTHTLILDDLTPEDVTFVRSHAPNAAANINFDVETSVKMIVHSGGSITFVGHLLNNSQIDLIQFSDGSSMTGDQISSQVAELGTSGNDTIFGEYEDDLLVGDEGDDQLIGEFGNDLLIGNQGNDSLWGDFGDDTLIGGEGTEQLLGGEGSDTFLFRSIQANQASTADYIFDFSTSSDVLDVSELGFTRFDTDGGQTEQGELRLSVNGGITTLVSEQTGFQVKIGGNHASANVVFSDVSSGIAGTYNNNTLNGSQNADTIKGFDGNDSLNGNQGNDTIYGHAGNDTINAGSGNDSIEGGVGNDSIKAQAGDDIVHGGEGNDWVSGWSGNDLVFGDLGDDTLYGYAGMDSLYGGNGDDSIIGGTDDDKLHGNDGDDRLVGGEGNNTLTGGKGSDIFDIAMSAGGTTIITDFIPSLGDVIDLSAFGNDQVITYDMVGKDIKINLPNNQTLILELFEPITLDSDDFIGVSEFTLTTNSGSSIGEIITGTSGNDSLTGENGADTITGGLGRDSLSGGEGGDVFAYNSRLESVKSGGAGKDAIRDFSAGSDQIDVSALGITTYLSSGLATNPYEIRTAIGNGKTYIKSDYDDANGLRFEVVLDGEYNLQATDFILATSSNDQNQTINGTSDGDSLTGGDGDDSITGGLGADTITSGNGADRIIYTSTNDSQKNGAGKDVIKDFDASEDMIDLSALGITTRLISGSANDSNEIRIGQTSSATYIKNDVDLGGSARFEIKLEGLHTLTNANFIFADSNDQIINGTSDNDILIGNSGNDTITGFVGTDRITTGEGVDRIVYTSTDDSQKNGSGKDIIEDFDVANDVIDLTALGITTRVTSGGANETYEIRVSQNSTATYIKNDVDLGGGATFEIKLEGLHTLTDDNFAFAENSTPTITGTNGTDALYGSIESEIINGKNGNDELYGNAGNDTLIGGKGGDYLQGDASNDVLQYNAISDSSYTDGVDYIGDFTQGDDVIDLSVISSINDVSDFSIYNDGVYTEYYTGDFAIGFNGDYTLNNSDFIFA